MSKSLKDYSPLPVNIREMSKEECKHIWIVSKWDVGDYDKGDFRPYGMHEAMQVICQICLEVKELE